jgi:hypothetical protein
MKNGWRIFLNKEIMFKKKKEKKIEVKPGVIVASFAILTVAIFSILVFRPCFFTIIEKI